jgi:hypothetical protein
MRPRLPSALAAALLAVAAHASAAEPAKPAAPAVDMKTQCAQLPPAPIGVPDLNANDLALRSSCVLAGILPSTDRIRDARSFALRSYELGDPAGGFMLYVVFNSDPANRYLKDGKPDLAAYQRLAARPVDDRKDQIQAIEALGFAAGKGHVNAGVLLAGYFHDTVAPKNVIRVRALTGLLAKTGHSSPLVERFGREAEMIEKVAPTTHASVRSFLDAYRGATSAALAGYRVQTGGKTCDKATLKSASAGDVVGAEYLPLKGTMVADSYLLKGEWPEYWTFDACGEEVPVKVTFKADGWGGAFFTAAHNKGQ